MGTLLYNMQFFKTPPWYLDVFFTNDNILQLFLEITNLSRRLVKVDKFITRSKLLKLLCTSLINNSKINLHNVKGKLELRLRAASHFLVQQGL